LKGFGGGYEMCDKKRIRARLDSVNRGNFTVRYVKRPKKLVASTILELLTGFVNTVCRMGDADGLGSASSVEGSIKTEACPSAPPPSCDPAAGNDASDPESDASAAPLQNPASALSRARANAQVDGDGGSEFVEIISEGRVDARYHAFGDATPAESGAAEAQAVATKALKSGKVGINTAAMVECPRQMPSVGEANAESEGKTAMAALASTRADTMLTTSALKSQQQHPPPPPPPLPQQQQQQHHQQQQQQQQQQQHQLQPQLQQQQPTRSSCS
jgi:hypothetical protein